MNPVKLIKISFTVSDEVAKKVGKISDIAQGWLMVRFIKQGPSSLHTGKYHFELPNKADKDAGEQL